MIDGFLTPTDRFFFIQRPVQPTAAELARKKTFLEDDSQYPRKIMIA